MHELSSEQIPSQKMPPAPGAEKQPRRVSRRKLIFDGVKNAFAAGLAVVGISATLSVPSERQKNPAELATITFRDYETDPNQFWVYDGKKVQQIRGKVRLKINERYMLTPAVSDLNRNPNQIYKPEDIPSDKDLMPALVLYTDSHHDTIDSNRSLFHRLLTRSKDLAGDRVMLILCRSRNLQPGLVSPEKDSTNTELPVFFPLDGSEESIANLQTYFPEFKFSPELLQEISDGSIEVYWRNFGSQLGHGALPDIYLIEKN